jgi:hypothetical protein
MATSSAESYDNDAAAGLQHGSRLTATLVSAAAAVPAAATV